MSTSEKLFKYQTALEKWKKERDFRANLTGKDLEKRNKKPLGEIPKPDLFELANDDIYAVQIKDRILGKETRVIPTRKTFTIPPRKTV